jgi:serine/threonine-protein kinase RsbW
MPSEVSRKADSVDTPENVRLKEESGKLRIEAPSHGSVLSYIRILVTDLAGKVGFAEDEVARIEIAVDEACSNVIEHAYQTPKEWHWENRSPEIRLELRAEAARLVIEINDHGKHFDFASYRPDPIETRLKQMQSGGYGISIMRKFMDEVHYSSSVVAGNTLRLVKYLKKP